MNQTNPPRSRTLARPTLYQQRVAELPTALLQHFQRAMQVGVWDNGLVLTQAQRRACQRALDTWHALGKAEQAACALPFLAWAKT